MEKQKCPSVRFNIFNDAWGEKNLANEVSFYSGLTYSPNDITNKNGTLVLRSSNVQNGEISLLDNVYVRPEVAYSQNVEVGDIIVVVRNGSRSLIGKHATIKKNMINTVIGAFMTGVKSSQPDFINALFDSNNFINQVNRNLGATINQITIGAFKEMNFNFPIVEEKAQIGKFFQNFDQSIALYEKKLSQTQNLKKAMLEKMFPKAGSTQPEIRLKGFSGDWVLSKIGEVFQVTSGATPLRSNLRFFENANFDWVKTTDLNNGIINKTEEKISSIALNETSIKILPKGTVFVAMYGGFNQIGRTGLLVSDATCNQALSAIYPNDKVEPYYLLTYLNFKVDSWKDLAASSRKDPNITKSDVLSFPLMFPSVKEQFEISQFFKQLDETLALQQQQLQNLKNLKKAFLEKMFV